MPKAKYKLVDGEEIKGLDKKVLFNFIDKDKFNNKSYRASSTFIGDLLEISTAIFQEYEAKKTGFKEHQYEIETKKILYDRNGAKFEIDVWVKFKAGKRYSKLVVFECKHLKGKVSRKQVNDFKTKVRDIEKLQEHPVSGVIVGKTFTRDALLACGAKEDNVQPLIVRDGDIKGTIPSASYFELVESRTSVIATEIESGNTYDCIAMQNTLTIAKNMEPAKIEDIINMEVNIDEIFSNLKEEVQKNGREGYNLFRWTKDVQHEGQFIQKPGGEQKAIKVKYDGYLKIFYSKSRMIAKFDFEEERMIIIEEIKMANDQLMPILYNL